MTAQAYQVCLREGRDVARRVAALIRFDLRWHRFGTASPGVDEEHRSAIRALETWASQARRVIDESRDEE